MLHSTILSHVFLAVFLYICTVAALTDRELEKIINTAVSGEELKDYRRYPDLEDLEDFKTNLDGLENLNEEGPEDFGSVETENVDDGMYGVDMRDKRAVEMENLDKEDRSEVVNRDNTHRRSNSLVKRFTATKHSAVPFKAHEADIIKRSTRQNEDKANTILDKVRQCLLDDSCLKRHVDKLIAKDASKDKFRIRTRNVFCNRRGCGRRKRSPSGQDQGQRQKRDTVRNGQIPEVYVKQERMPQNTLKNILKRSIIAEEPRRNSNTNSEASSRQIGDVKERDSKDRDARILVHQCGKDRKCRQTRLAHGPTIAN